MKLAPNTTALRAPRPLELQRAGPDGAPDLGLPCKLLVEGAEDRVDAGRGPEIEERRALQGEKLTLVSLLRLGHCLAGPPCPHAFANGVLVVNSRVLDVPMQLLELGGVQDDDR